LEPYLHIRHIVTPSFSFFERHTSGLLKPNWPLIEFIYKKKITFGESLWLIWYVSIFKKCKIYLIGDFPYSRLVVDVNLSQVIGKRHARNKHGNVNKIYNFRQYDNQCFFRVNIGSLKMGDRFNNLTKKMIVSSKTRY
jgi:hypothetical protein